MSATAKHYGCIAVLFSAVRGPKSSGDQSVLLFLRFQVVASMSFIALLRRYRIQYFVFGLLFPIIGSAMLAGRSRFILG